MGKPYHQELNNLSGIWYWGKEKSIDKLRDFKTHTGNKPLYVVASGGSATAAVLAAQLHELTTGHMVKWVTPLEFIQSNNVLENCNVLLISASGNNTEIIDAYNKALDALSNDAIIGIICTSTSNKLIKVVNSHSGYPPKVIVQSTDMPIKRDGFLATNTLFCTCLWLLRAYDINMPDFNQLFTLYKRNTIQEEVYKGLEKFNKVKTIIVLYDRYTKMTAIDIESKLVESGLANVQLADYRNFAHGRWNFIDKNKNIGVVALNTNDMKKMASDTLNLLPKSTPVYNMHVDIPGIFGGAVLLVKSFYITQFFGDLKHVDPGKPKIPEFGRKIHHMKWNINQESID